jgi:hypothetical protein
VAPSRPSARPAAVGSAVVGAVLAAVLSGCSATNPITTEKPYSASDGVRATLGSVTAENLLLITAEADAPGALQGALSNRGDDAVAVTVGVGGDSQRFWIESGDTVLLGGTQGEDAVFTTPAAPGATTELTLTTAADGTETFQVPVLDGTLPEYAELVPASD